MPSPEQLATYEIQLANALLETVMAKAMRAMEILLDGPDGGNAHVARAVQLILDEHAAPLQHRLQQIEATISRHNPAPMDWQTPQSQLQLAERLTQVTHRYQEHMTSHFPADLEHTGESVQYTLMIMPMVINHAVSYLNSEIITREPDDLIRTAHIEAIRQIAPELHGTGVILNVIHQQRDTNDDRKRRFLRDAQAALNNAQRILATHAIIIPDTPEADVSKPN